MKYHETWYPFDAASIKAHVPPTSGVYMLFGRQQCVVVGASEDLQAALTKHLTSNDPCIVEHVPDEFQFEVVLGPERFTRRDELAATLKPACAQS